MLTRDFEQMLYYNQTKENTENLIVDIKNYFETFNVAYKVLTFEGNSGSVVFDYINNKAIGMHCSSASFANVGVSSDKILEVFLKKYNEKIILNDTLINLNYFDLNNVITEKMNQQFFSTGESNDNFAYFPGVIEELFKLNLKNI
jgi:V8-like Glu-specific endopeptidase